MRFSRALNLVMMVGLVSCLLTICLWSTCTVKSSSLNDARVEMVKRDEPSFVHTEYHNRGTNSLRNTEAEEEEEEEGGEDETDTAEEDGEAPAIGKSLKFSPQSDVSDIDCNINGETTVQCKKVKDEVYLPWSFVKPYFEVFGEMDKDDTFNFHHANSLVHPPQPTYGPGSMFMAFDHYTVETRDRVKCVTASEDSLQTKGIALPVTEKTLKCFKVDIKFSTNGSISILGELSNGEKVKIHFVFSREHIALDLKGGNIYYGMGERRNEWIHLARQLIFDVMKGFLQKIKMERVKDPLWFKRILEVRVHGHGWLDNLTLTSDVHLDQFFDSANWLVKHQDDRGGWPIMVTRRLVTGVMELAPGWYSAMGQGQAMSVLARAYTLTKDRTYLDAAVRGLKLFEVDSAQGGVRARFMGKLDWYEEYPTIPSSFVLNGFIFSLLGLYDLTLVADGQGKEAAERIYNSGMTSLKTNIGMYDTGQGTLYDLRHVSAGLPPNRARWDYHTTHINQLLQLMVIDDSEIFKTIAHRWIGYLKGHRSRHN
ncbi:hypothetical protein EGW08_011527 [Elysia chlorotica]|uniref:heparosan-N-sulfate-glucuronate 5-epimerase n=1 Tax=Elysia chlorotica TaxID=188477 RepID=A0A3S0ZQY3_ELYCH|nr:hypothetical protein EGW08_011527 [Elysia chlorotica]